MSICAIYSEMKPNVLIKFFSDNLRYGVNFAKRFIDGPDKKGLKKTGELRNLMNLHNNKAGRMVKC